MIKVPETKELIQHLAEKHQQAQSENKHWTDVWQVFSDDVWFKRRLDYSARRVLRRCNLPAGNKDDIQQEALIQFANSVQRDCSLGFKPERGDYGAYLATIINRCCQKGMRQFNRSFYYTIDNESQHPVTQEWESLENQLDLETAIRTLKEPYRSTMKLICDGQTIDEIAKRKRKSARTIYRWLDKGTEILRIKLSNTDKTN